jgi:hypothetical protein
MHGPGPRLAAQLAQVAAQALTAWALLVVWVTHFRTAPGGLVMLSLLLVVALSLPARMKRLDRDRAISNFTSGLLIWSVLAWGLLLSLIDFALGGYTGFPLSTQQTLMLVATVLYMFAGAFFWILGRGEA